MKRAWQCQPMWVMAVILGVVAASRTVLADAGGIMYQGTLADPSGTAPADGAYPMTFSIWTGLVGGSKVWEETGHTVMVTKGTFAASAHNHSEANITSGKVANTYLNTGVFAWADGSNFDFTVSTANSFGARCVGGAQFVSAIDGTGVATAGVTLAAGGGSWTSLSDRNAKENITPINVSEVLDKVAALPISTWNYKAQDASIRHVGPMAQDMHAAFGVGETDKGIRTVDADGVALAAIQGLNERLKKKDQEVAQLRAELQELKAVVAGMAVT